MRLCHVTEDGFEYVGKNHYSSIGELEKDMRKNPQQFTFDTEYTLHEDKPILVLRSETKVRLEKK